MTWRDRLIDANLLPCSFRGVEMLWDSNRLQGGRRIVKHQYPLRDVAEIEDLGDGPRTFSFEACVLGADYAAQRDQLIKALEQPGPGQLVHPHFGNVNVCIERWEVEHSTQAGGLARFTIECVRDDAVTSPTVNVDTKAAVVDAADLAQQQVLAQFVDTYSLPDNFARETALGRATDLLRQAARSVSSVYEFGDGKLRQLQQGLLNPVLDGRSLLQNVVDLPGDLGYRLQSMILGITSASSLRALFARYSSGSVSGSSRPVGTLDTLAQQTTAVALAAQISADDYASYDEAKVALRIAVDALDVIGATAADITYSAIVDLRTALTADINTRAANLARITTYRTRVTLPAFVVAHRLYGAANLEANAADIVARNGIRHPGFVPGGNVLEVLTP